MEGNNENSVRLEKAKLVRSLVTQLQQLSEELKLDYGTYKRLINLELGAQEIIDELDSKEKELQARINSFTYQIESFRTGTQVNKGESAVRVTCIETGKVVECSEHRSRYQNIEQAKRMLNENDNN